MEKKKNYGLFAMTGYVLAAGARKRPLLPPLFFLLFAGIGIATTAYTFVKQRFFETVETLIFGQVNLSVVIGYGVVVSLFPIFLCMMKSANSIVVTAFFGVTKGYLGKQLNDKASRVDPLVYEDNRFLDQINKAYVGLEAVGAIVNNLLFVVLNQLVYFISMAVYLFTVKPALLLMLCIAFLPNVIGMAVRKRMYTKLEHKAAPYRRRYEYFEKCICSREYVKETRLWRSEGFFKRLYRGNLSEYTRLQWNTTKHTRLIEMGLRFLTLTGYVGMIIMLFYYLSRGEVSVGAFAAIFTSLDNLFGQIAEMFDVQFGAISEKYGAAQNYFAFLNLPERQGQSEEPLKRETIELKGVSFSYPCSEKPALENINLTVHKGETIAIVGVNGSGKSTLTRLLMGLYLPTSGEMLVDGRNVSRIAPKTLYQGVSAVFQRYQSYKMTVAENTRISDAEKEQEQNVAVKDALEKANFPLESEKLTDGLETMLGKDFGGIDLSGGQWQRLAIARGLYRDHEMIVLDEPTAAIDPLEEADIYHKFAEISRDKTAFIVTHRLGSAQIADRIIVMDAGHIVDIGTHEELMQREGKYREMYHAQAKWYA